MERCLHVVRSFHTVRLTIRDPKLTWRNGSPRRSWQGLWLWPWSKPGFSLQEGTPSLSAESSGDEEELTAPMWYDKLEY